MSRKNIIILIIVAVLAAGGIGGFIYYKNYKKQHQPNADMATMPVTVPNKPNQTATSEMAVPNPPQYTGLESEASGLYPTLSGKYEKIWDGYDSFPLEILADGDDTVQAAFKFIWSRNYLYIQVSVTDATPDVSNEDYGKQDSVELFLNEDGNKNSQLLIGDAHYIINRSNTKYIGRGANENFESVTYETYDEEGNNTGYIVEAALPLMTVKGSKNMSVGFDVQVNDAVDGKNSAIKKWASDYLYTFQNFSALGTVTFK